MKESTHLTPRSDIISPLRQLVILVYTLCINWNIARKTFALIVIVDKYFKSQIDEPVHAIVSLDHSVIACRISQWWDSNRIQDDQVKPLGLLITSSACLSWAFGTGPVGSSPTMTACDFLRIHEEHGNDHISFFVKGGAKEMRLNS